MDGLGGEGGDDLAAAPPAWIRRHREGRVIGAIASTSPRSHASM
jgi:hypothetical protein